MLRQLVLYSAALMGSTFLFAMPALASPPVVQSQPDHDVRQNRVMNQEPGPDAAFVENLMFQVQDLQQQVAEQRGRIEELNYEVQILKQEQKERYIDLDQRILALQQQLENAAASASQPAQQSSSVSTEAVSDEQVLAEYNAARDLIRERKFPEAVEALSEFAQAHPDHALTPNAWYWLGEVHLVSRDVSQARDAFKQVVESFSGHSKVPDSLYKLGVIAQQQGSEQDAKRYFERVIADFPGSQSAKLAKARLNSN